MRNHILLTAKLLAAIAAAFQAPVSFAHAQGTQPQGIETIGSKVPATASERCVDVEIAGSRSFSCLNQELKRQADQINPSVNVAPIDARSPDIQVGVVNVPAVQQQYGQNFGRSVIPYRPAPPIFTSPLLPHR